MHTLSDQPLEDGDETENFRFGSIHGLTNVTVQVGTIAYMHCPVVNLGEREVSFSVVIFVINLKQANDPKKYVVKKHNIGNKKIAFYLTSTPKILNSSF